MDPRRDDREGEELRATNGMCSFCIDDDGVERLVSRSSWTMSTCGAWVSRSERSLASWSSTSVRRLRNKVTVIVSLRDEGQREKGTYLLVRGVREDWA